VATTIEKEESRKKRKKKGRIKMKVGDSNNGSVELCGAIILSFNFTQASIKPIKFSRLGGSQGTGEALDKGT
jgi:hypothetical protein